MESIVLESVEVSVYNDQITNTFHTIQEISLSQEWLFAY